MQLKSILQETGLFENVSEDILEKISSTLLRVNFSAKEIIIREGDLGDAFYVIESGAVTVFTHDANGEERILAKLEKGDFFGEQALLGSNPKQRNASVKALEDTRLLKITKVLLQELLKADQERKK